MTVTTRGEDGAIRRSREDDAMLFDCPECGLPATVTTRGHLPSTAGPVEHVQVHCVTGHRFLGPAESLRVVLSPDPA
ncbi:hypothetical protein [Jiangella gansuensis]|uniref:hypothetical protein n=1 Tax=Jiangella gansuensis TaxID=281473 RepID=UPI000567DE1F|nr:hypothetical protein [Jiangella gansuensis]